jgi:NAD-dependent SIR2 family protein deacetylase
VRLTPLAVLTGAGTSAESGIPTFRGAYLVEVNPEETTLTRHADQALRGPAGQRLPAWWKEIQKSKR